MGFTLSNTPVIRPENFTICLSHTFLFGTPESNLVLSEHCDKTMKISKLMTNVVAAGTIFIRNIRIGLIAINQGSGELDAFCYRWASGRGHPFPVRPVPTGTRIAIELRYNGYIPYGYRANDPYTVTFGFVGKCAETL